jgi:undecaprenyl-diphosphatase
MSALLANDAALAALVQTWRTGWLDGPMWLLSAVGTGGAIWLALAAVMAAWWPRLRGSAWQVVLALLLSYGVVDGVVKPLVGRPRPFVAARSAAAVIGHVPETMSFPSGHAASAFAGAFVLGCAWPRRRAWLFALAAFIAASRVYVGVHYPLDVAAGTVVGLGIGVLVTGGRAWYIQGSSVAPTSCRGSSVGRAYD